MISSRKRPGTDLFKVEVFHDFLLEVSADLQKLSAELFHSRYQNPNQPTAFLIEVTNLCRANTVSESIDFLCSSLNRIRFFSVRPR